MGVAGPLAADGVERDGTLPNTIFGEDASNRDTSDAPLWFGLVHEEFAAMNGALSAIGRSKDDSETPDSSLVRMTSRPANMTRTSGALY